MAHYIVNNIQETAKIGPFDYYYKKGGSHLTEAKTVLDKAHYCTALKQIEDSLFKHDAKSIFINKFNCKILITENQALYIICKIYIVIIF